MRPEFIKVDYAVYTDSALSPWARLLFSRLQFYAGADGKAYPKQETLARELGVSDRQVRIVLSELRALNRIAWTRTRTSSVFEIKPASEWKTASALDRKTASTLGSPDRKRMSDLDRKRLADLDRKRSSDRKEVLKRGIEKKTTQKLITGCASPKTGEGLPDAALPANGNSKHALSLADMTGISKRMADFMDEAPPKPTQEFVMALATQYNLSAADILGALNAAWQRGAAPGQKNAPRQWKWFNEALRRAFVPGAAARLPEHPSAGADAMAGLMRAEQAVQEEYNRRAMASFDTLDEGAAA